MRRREEEVEEEKKQNGREEEGRIDNMWEEFRPTEVRTFLGREGLFSPLISFFGC